MPPFSISVDVSGALSVLLQGMPSGPARLKTIALKYQKNLRITTKRGKSPTILIASEFRQIQERLDSACPLS
jgi:hypothetical protein